MTTIYLIRHAEAEGNLCRRIHGHFDTNITPNGMKQIQDLSVRFANIPVDACYCSDLTRTRTTAQAIYLQKNLPLQTDPAFREISLGCWEDLPFGYLYTRLPEEMNRFCRDPQLWHVEGSETFEEYTSRFLKAMNRAVEAAPNGTIAIVSHGAVLRGVLSVLFPDVEIGHADNTAVTCLTYSEKHYSLNYLNDSSHLQAGESLFAKQTWWKKNSSGNDRTLWFRKEAPHVAELTPLSAQITYSAFCGEDCIGYVCIDEGEEYCRVVDMALLPEYRGRDLSIQLLGQALFHSRALHKRTLLMDIPDKNLPMQHLCKKLFFHQSGINTVSLDLKVRVIPL